LDRALDTRNFLSRGSRSPTPSLDSALPRSRASRSTPLLHLQSFTNTLSKTTKMKTKLCHQQHPRTYKSRLPFRRTNLDQEEEELVLLQVQLYCQGTQELERVETE
jgi:hypothetical protein